MNDCEWPEVRPVARFKVGQAGFSIITGDPPNIGCGRCKTLVSEVRVVRWPRGERFVCWTCMKQLRDLQTRADYLRSLRRAMAGRQHTIRVVSVVEEDEDET